MNYFKTNSAHFFGAKTLPIEIECVQMRKIPYLQIIGCSASSANAMRERVQAAIASSNIRLPARKFTVQIRPSVDSGAIEHLDLAVALTILGSASVFPPQRLQNVLICGSLGLDGRILALGAAHSIQKILKKRNFTSAILAWEDSNLLEAQQLKLGGGFRSLMEALDFLRKENSSGTRMEALTEENGKKNPTITASLRDPLLQRAFSIAAAGAHHTILLGAQSTVNSHLAGKFSHFLPALKDHEREEISAAYKVGNLDWNGKHPFRNPPMNATEASLRGKKSDPGEYHLAGGGILFLDSLLERPKGFLLALKKLQEDSVISRDHRSALPIVLAASTLCACGEFGSKKSECLCRQTDLQRFRQRLRQFAQNSFDLSLQLRAQKDHSCPAHTEILSEQEARSAMLLRQGKANGVLMREEVFEVKRWSDKALSLWKKTEEEPDSFRLARVALTISDLKGAKQLDWEDLLEARHYRASRFFSR